MNKLYVVQQDGTVIFLTPVNVEKPVPVQEQEKVAVFQFWKDRAYEDTPRYTPSVL